MERDFENESQDVIAIKRPSSQERTNQIWTVASGKGGVGKTFVTSSLAICLSKLGHSVVIVDLDLSGANVHTAFGMSPASNSIRHFFEGSKTLSELVIPTQVPRVSYIQGFWDAWTPTDLSVEQVRHLAPEMKKLNADYVIVDLGAGALESHLEMLKLADEKILLSSPEPTSIEKTYRFIESFVCHSLKDHSIPEAYDHMIQQLRNHRHGFSEKNFSFRTYLRENSGIQPDFFDALMTKPLRLIVNSCRSQANTELGHAMKSVCYKYYDFKVDFLGSIDYDNAVWQSIRNREPVLIAQPFTPLAGQFLTTCKQLIDPKELRAVI
ncbi:P-loop NTPase [Bdellovibrio sp. HCB337]|uniref:P-loop NTPase n=1 Tax=Bdellovibrio sp. HCB337 TaxID=3394358 RepID=UPI0039A57B32